MGSTTPKYAFPYPIGTDRVMDGDNAIQALAERVEAVLAGTGSGGNAWSVRQGAGGVFGANAWTPILSIALTSCPIGAVVAVLASAGLSTTTATAVAQARLTSAGATIAPAGAAPKTNQSGANLWSNIAVFGLATVTAAAPTINLEGFVNTGTANVDLESHMIAIRVI